MDTKSRIRTNLNAEESVSFKYIESKFNLPICVEIEKETLLCGHGTVCWNWEKPLKIEKK